MFDFNDKVIKFDILNILIGYVKYALHNTLCLIISTKNAQLSMWIL